MSEITIIDYGMGNLASVQKALVKLGHTPKLTNLAADIESAERLILPGVGAFGAAMANLEKQGLVEPIRNYAASGRPFLGICLGMQLLMSESNELGCFAGLDLIPGKVTKFYNDSIPPLDIKIPHMGWNALDLTKKSGIFDNTNEGASVYFVHSYYVVPDDTSVIAAEATHGETFCAAIGKDNIWATQFHPEKSGNVGMTILKSFCELPS